MTYQDATTQPNRAMQAGLVNPPELACEPLAVEAPTEVFTADAGAAAPFTSYDDTNAGLIPPDATHSSYYANGWPANLGAVRARCPHAELIGVLIVRGQIPPLKQIVAWEHGVEFDIEPTDWEPGDAGNIAKTALNQGVRPVLYCSLSDAPAVVASVHAAGVRRDQFKLHTAHWTGQPHICSGIATDMGTVSADATQYTDKAQGLNLDASLCKPDFFGAAKANVKHATGLMQLAVSFNADPPHGRNWAVHRLGGNFKAGSVDHWSSAEIQVNDKTGAVRIKGEQFNAPPLG